MLSKIVNSSIRNCCKATFRPASTAVTRKSILNYKKSLVLFGGVGSLMCFDYFVNDAEYLGATLRFMRSLKIAAEISVDYNIGLYGLVDDTEEYNKVNFQFQVRFGLIEDFSIQGHQRNPPTIGEPLARWMLGERRALHQDWARTRGNQSHSARRVHRNVETSGRSGTRAEERRSGSAVHRGLRGHSEQHFRGV